MTKKLPKMTIFILCCLVFKVDARCSSNNSFSYSPLTGLVRGSDRSIVNHQQGFHPTTMASGCYTPYLRLRSNSLNHNFSTRAALTPNHNNIVASEKVPACLYDLVRGYVVDFTKSTELATNITDENIISLMTGEMTMTKTPSFSSLSSSSLPLERNQDRNEKQELHYSGLTIPVAPNVDPNYRRHLAGDQAACFDSTFNMIVESVNLVMTLVGLGGVGKAVGRSVAKKMKKDGLNEAKAIGQRLGSSTDKNERAQAVADIVLLAFSIGFDSVLKSIEDNVEFWEWTVLVITVSVQLAALVLSGGTALFLQLLALGISLTTFGIAAANVARDCEDVPEIGCRAYPGFVFYEGLNSDGGNLLGWANGENFGTIANECLNEEFCKGFNTLRWRKIIIRPYDEWVPMSGSCAGVFVREDVEVCRAQLDGFQFYPLFDSPGNTVSSQPSMSLEDLAEICQNEGNACQGFNTDGDKKSIIQNIPAWNRPEALCQGLYVKKSIDICPSAPGYTFYNDFISEGDDLVNLNEDGGFIDQLVEECENRGSACTGFTTFGSLKSAIAPHRDWIPSGFICYGTFVKSNVLVDVPIDCNDLDEYEYYPNKDSSGGDIERLEGASKSEMAQACNDDPDCEGFNTNFYLKRQIKSPYQMGRPEDVKGFCQGLYVKQGIIYPPDAYCQSGGRVVIDTASRKRFRCSKSYPGEMKLIWRTLATTDYGFDDDAYYIRVMKVKDGSVGEEVYSSIRKTLTQGSGSGSFGIGGDDNGFVVDFECDNFITSCEGGDFEFKLVSCDCPGGADPILNCDSSSVSRARDAICPATSAPTQVPTTSNPTVNPATILCPSKYVRIKEVCAIPEFESDGKVEIKIRMNGIISWPKYEGCPSGSYSGGCELPNESVVGCYELSGSEQRLFTEAQSIPVRVIDEDIFGDDYWSFDVPAATWYDPFDCGESEFEIPYSNLLYPGFKIIVDVAVNPDPTQLPTQLPVSSDFGEPGMLTFCFSERATVQVRDKGSIPIKNLRVGDHVMTGDTKKIYQPVYAFAHRDEIRFAEFLSIAMLEIDNHSTISKTATKINDLEITGNHLVYVQNKGGRPIRADSLTVGDILYGSQGTGMDGHASTMHHSVVKIKKVVRGGYYAPLTPHGSIIVNGILASTYVGVSSKTSSEYVQIKGIDLPLLQADGVHIALSPLRLVCKGITFFSSMMYKNIKGEISAHANSSSYKRGNDGSKQPYVSICLRFASWVEEQHIFVQIIIFCLALLTFGFFALMEKAVVDTASFRMILVCFVCAMTHLFSRKQEKRKC